MGDRFRTILFCSMTTAVRFFFLGIFFFHTKLRNIVHITNKNYIYNNPIYNTNHLIYLFNNLIYNSNNPIYFFNNLIYNSNNKNYLSNNNNYISNIKYIFYYDQRKSEWMSRNIKNSKKTFCDKIKSVITNRRF